MTVVSHAGKCREKIALSKLNTWSRLLIKYLLVEETEVLFQMRGGRAKKFTFELKRHYFRNLLQKLSLHKDLILFVGKPRIHDDRDTPST